MDSQDIDNRFTFHPVKNGQAEKYEAIRGAAKEYALLLNQLCPESREKSLAITHLEDVVYCANASIARHE